MFKNEKFQGENSTKRQNQGQICLEKLIRLDCRDSNFQYRDQHRNAYFRVYYPHSNTQVSTGQHLLKKFWRHVQTYYFKKPQIDQLYRLQYIKTIFKQPKQNEKPFADEYQFWELLKQTFSSQQLQKLNSSQLREAEQQNILKRMYVLWKLSHQNLKHSQRREVTEKLRISMKGLGVQKNKKRYQNSLKQEEKVLNSLLESNQIDGDKYNDANQIQNQIRKLQKQLIKSSVQNNQILRNIQEGLNQNKHDKMSANNNVINIKNQKVKTKTIKKKLNEFTMDEQFENAPQSINLNQVLFLIKSLQERQLAESMSKILQCQKINGEFHFLVAFQNAMSVQPKFFTEKQLMKYNKLRQTSLYQFYRTGVKSLYSYICQNFAGFSELVANRSKISKTQGKDIFDMMKKTGNNYQILTNFSKFNTCHHCKFLYPDYLLKSCKFVSDRQSLPKSNFEHSNDPDFVQIMNENINQQKARTSQRFMTRKKNCLTGYSKINQQYVCGRKYCISCLKDNYPNEIMNESIFCPFCQGNCTCSRCLRNQKIVKFKNVYTILGGDFTTLSNESCLQELQQKQQGIVPRRRGRPKKQIKKTHIVTNKVIKKIARGPLKNELNLLGKRRILLSSKKDKSIKKKTNILNNYSKNISIPKRKRGRPPKNSSQSLKKFTKLLGDQYDATQIQNLIASMKK